MTRGHFVYRFFDHDGSPLYVGSTVETSVRFDTHRRNAPWWGLVDESRTVVTNHPTEDEKIRTEESEICALSPRYNVAGVNVGYTPPLPERPINLEKRLKPRTTLFPDQLWADAKAIADSRYEKMSTVLRQALVEYVEKHSLTFANAPTVERDGRTYVEADAAVKLAARIANDDAELLARLSRP